MQALNQARSAFVIFRLTSRFFTSFRRTSDDAAPAAKVQIQVKPCVAVFRAHASVDHCDMVLDTDANCVVFVMHCKGGVQKKHRICTEDSNANKAMYSKITPNRIVARARTLLDCVQNFHTSIEEITLVPQAHHLTLKSYVELDATAGGGGGGGGGGAAGGAAGGARGGVAPKDAPTFLKTELVLDCNDFEEYAVKPNAGEITFSLKELRAILTFSEAAGMPLSIYFSDPGQPVLWSVNCFDALVVDFVLATMAAVGGGATQCMSRVEEVVVVVLMRVVLMRHAASAAPPTSSSQAVTGLSAAPSHSATPRGGYARGANTHSSPVPLCFNGHLHRIVAAAKSAPRAQQFWR